MGWIKYVLSVSWIYLTEKQSRGASFLIPRAALMLLTAYIFVVMGAIHSTKISEISVQNLMDRFGPTGKVWNKLVHLLRWTNFSNRTGWNFG